MITSNVQTEETHRKDPQISWDTQCSEYMDQIDDAKHLLSATKFKSHSKISSY